jgi:hypothetical protein
MIWLQTPTVFWLGGEIISLICSMYVCGVSYVRQKEINTTEPQCLSQAPELEMTIEKRKVQKLPSIDEIPAELIRTQGRKIRSEIHKLINSILNKEELPEDWKESYHCTYLHEGR